MPEEEERGAAQLASDALDLAIAGRLEEAEALCRAAVISARSSNHLLLANFETQLAGVLARRGAHAEAEMFHRRALGSALAYDNGQESSLSVGITRYFFAEYLVSQSRGVEALEILAPALEHALKLEGVLRYVQAKALLCLGRHDEARDAGQRALALARHEEQAARMREGLAAAGWKP